MLTKQVHLCRVAAVAAPVIQHVTDAVVSTVGDSILVEISMHAGFDIGREFADDLFIDEPIYSMIPSYSEKLETMSVKTMLITQFKHTFEDASLGFYRSGVHKCVY